MNIIRENWKAILFIILIFISYLAFYFYKWEYRKPLFEIHFFNLNKGRAIFIRTRENKTILIGAGQNTEIINKITENMPFYKRKIDYIFIPSSTAQYSGGFIDIIDRYKIGEIFILNPISTSTVIDKIKEKIKENNLLIKEITEGDNIKIEEDLYFDILFPSINFEYNKSSLKEMVIKIRYKNTNIYLFGDISKKIQKYIFNKYINEEGDIENQNINILEFYNNMPKTKIFSELLEKLKPFYIFNKKERRDRSLFSNGIKWDFID